MSDGTSKVIPGIHSGEHSSSLCHFVLKRAPAETATLVAAQGGGHLDATVACNAVKLVLVAHIPASKCPFAPHTGFERC